MKYYILSAFLLYGCEPIPMKAPLHKKQEENIIEVQPRSGVIQGVLKEVWFGELTPDKTFAIYIKFENKQTYRFEVEDDIVWFGDVGKEIRYHYYNSRLFKVERVEDAGT